MELTAQQRDVVTQLDTFLGGTEKCFVLKGYAGTGKTFLLGHLAKLLGERRKEVWLLAPTGRAARVLSRKTGHEASTIHRAIYDLKELVEHDDAKAAFKFYFRLKDVTTDNLDMVAFVDEASMVSDQYTEGEFLRFGSGRVLADLIQFLRLGDPSQKTKLVMVGDPAQLPPVNSPISPALDIAYLKEVHNLRAREFELTEVVRQAAGSPILAEATEIRKTIASGFHNKLSIKPSPPEIETVLEPDLPSRFVKENGSARLPRTVCVAYSNATCRDLNIAIRSRKFGGDGMQAPCGADVLLVIRNNAATGLLNGDLISVSWADANPKAVRVRVGTEDVDLSFRDLRIIAESENGKEVEINTKIVENVLFSEKRDLTPLEQKALYVHFKMRYPELRPNTKEFAAALRADPFFNALQVKFGYAMTCHKAQGGEWDDVFLYFEHARTDALALRWAYTALTRARSRIFGINLPDRQPWTGALPAAANASLRPPAAGNVMPTQAHAATPSTKWDELFPIEPSFLREQHRRMAAALEKATIVLEDVQVRTGNYYWRYGVCRGGMRAKIQVSFKKNGVLTPQELPVAGCDAALGAEALAIVQLPPMPPTPETKAPAFPEDRPYLRSFYQDFMLPKAQAAGATVIRIDHHKYMERYHFGRGSAHASLDAIYRARGTVTSIALTSGDEDLGREILEGE